MKRKLTSLAATLMTSVVLVSQTAPAGVVNPLMPVNAATNVESSSDVTNVVKPAVVIQDVEGEGKDYVKVTAQIYKPAPATSDATSNAIQNEKDNITASLCYRQVIGEKVQEDYLDYNKIEMKSEDGKTFTATIPAEKLFGSNVTWKIEAGYDGSVVTETEETTTKITPSALKGEDSDATPLYITEVAAKTKSGTQFTYFEVYNQSDKPVNLAYYKILYYYDYPNKSASSS